MFRLGRILLILGIGSFILPFFHMQFALLRLFGPNQFIAGLALIAVGIALMVLDAKSRA